MPIWTIGLFCRDIWSPDEPREYDIAYNMLQSGDLVVPRLAGAPFVEKPPLAYWVQSASMRLFGPSIAAARVPNLLWAVLAILSVGALAGDAAGEQNRQRAALIAAIVCATVGLVLQVQIWMSTDAPLVALTAAALLSGWRLAHAVTLRQRLTWSLLFGLSLAGAALAKNGFGLLVPVLTIVTWLAWERQLRELRRWPWWLAAASCALVISGWLAALANRPEGAELLRALLWDNLVARFLPFQSGAAYDLGHESSHWKFLLLLPVYVLPWTFAIVGAGPWLAGAANSRSESSRALRYCICAIIPACVVLLLSRTARGVYFAPALLCVGVLLALWFTARSGAFSRFEQAAVCATRYALQALALLLTGGAVLLLVLVGMHTFAAVVAAAMVAFVLVGTVLSRRASGGATHGLAAATTLFLAALAAIELVAFPIIDRTENLPALIAAAGPHLGKAHVASYCADETTRATLDYVLDLRPPDICGIEDARALLRDHDDQQFLVQLARPRTAQRLSELFPGLRLRSSNRRPRAAPGLAQLASLGLQPAVCWSVQGGRKYALYGRTSDWLSTSAATCSPTD